jgi:hypothetical protein
MKKIAYLMICAGFLFGAYTTALDTRNVDWLLFGIAAAAAVIGLILAKRVDRAEATSGDLLETNRNELNESIANVVRDLKQMTDGTAARGEELRDWIDEKLRPDLRRFVDARESMVHLYGLQTYADIMSEFAAGERYVNRVWSSSADGYDGEAETYLHRAAEQFADAQQQLAGAGND